MGTEAISISSLSVPLPKPRSIRRNLINEALGAPLERMCIEATADLAMVIQAHPSTRARGTVLAFYAADGICEFLPNEPIQFDPPLPNAPEATFDLDFRSIIRPFHLSCSSSMIIPWGSRTSIGWLIIANSGRPDSVYVTHKYRQALQPEAAPALYRLGVAKHPSAAARYRSSDAGDRRI